MLKSSLLNMLATCVLIMTTISCYKHESECYYLREPIDNLKLYIEKNGI